MGELRFIINKSNHLYDENYIFFAGNELFPVIVSNKRHRILSFYSESEIKKIISCVSNHTAKGKRDLLIVLFAAELGIRSGDICRLKISDIHWERNTIEFIQFKTGVFNQLPLLENIKFALINYLKDARPACESDLLFVGIKNNYQMISASQMHSVVSKYFTLAGIDISKRKHGPHALRHSLASNLLVWRWRICCIMRKKIKVFHFRQKGSICLERLQSEREDRSFCQRRREKFFRSKREIRSWC